MFLCPRSQRPPSAWGQTPGPYLGLSFRHCDSSKMKVLILSVPGCVKTHRGHCQETPGIQEPGQPHLRAKWRPEVNCFISLLGLSPQTQGLSGQSSHPAPTTHLKETKNNSCVNVLEDS